MGIVGSILIGAFGLWYLTSPKSAIRLYAWLSIVKKENKAQPTLIGIRLIGAVIIALLAAVWIAHGVK